VDEDTAAYIAKLRARAKESSRGDEMCERVKQYLQQAERYRELGKKSVTEQGKLVAQRMAKRYEDRARNITDEGQA
jgi:hypothetical protein